MKITIEEIKNKMNCKYVNNTVYFIATFLDDNNIDDFNQVEFVKMNDYFDSADKPNNKYSCYKTTHPTKAMLLKDATIYRVNHYIVLK